MALGGNGTVADDAAARPTAAVNHAQPEGHPMTIPEGRTPAQLAGAACVKCAADEVPLHRGETITTRYADGVVRDTTVARCTPCLIAQRRPAKAEATQ